MGHRRTSNHDLPPSLHMKGERYHHVTSIVPRKWTPLGNNRPRALLE